MKRFKQTSAILLLLLFSIFLAACGGSAEPAAEPEVVEQVEEIEEAVIEEASEPEPAVVEEMEEVSEPAAEIVEEVEVVEEVSEPEAEMAEEMEAEEEAVVEEAESEEVAEAAPAESEAEMVAIVAPTDFDKLGQTGRPAFLNSYANWWSTWRANAPVVDGLKSTFEGQVDFFDLDIDDPELDKLRQEQRINNRSHYILLAPDGETVLRQWFGPLDAGSMEAQVAAVLRDNGY